MASTYCPIHAKTLPSTAMLCHFITHAIRSDEEGTGGRTSRRSSRARGSNLIRPLPLAMLELDKSQTSDKAIVALRRALEVKSDYADARLQLGLM